MADPFDAQPSESLVMLGSVLRMPADKYGRRFRTTVRVIDTIHKVKATRPIDVLVSNDRDVTGRYNRHGGTGEPISIEVSKRDESMEEKLVHEIGHFLENALIPGSAFGVRGWSSDEVTRRWRLAIKATESFQVLEELASLGTARPANREGGAARAGSSRRFLASLLTEQELWARSYAQWVMLRGQDETLARQIRKFRSPPSVYPLQSNHAEFEAVAAEFDSLFERIGWRI